ncbi:hypothetical protein DL764_006417 [Monosporascus ibericus]|uniref:Chromate ion transporter n=1 Tax=Monosporascus ibericus TaxID=155417 RepID=A0A4Q4T4U2_9PEZI|nr:hypothetical protein DL764_006417 [Monosporascus ibericus]
MGILPFPDLSDSKVVRRLWNTTKENWYLGFTSFGGPPVHFKIFRDKFVNKRQWIDDQVYQELFSVCQAFSGPGSTKMLYCINLIHDGFLSAVLALLFWSSASNLSASLPGALGMYGLAVGVSNIGDALPAPVYALLSGLNAATVGIVALAAVELAHKAITDRVTRVLVFLGAAAGLLYNALWYFPLIIVIGGIITVIHDFRWLHGPVKAVRNAVMRKKQRPAETEETIDLPRQDPSVDGSVQKDTRGDDNISAGPSTGSAPAEGAKPGLPTSEREAAESGTAAATAAEEPRFVPPERRLNFSWKFGLAIICSFFISFLVIMVLRGVLPNKGLLYSLFANMYLAGTIIFGGGPVVVPLLREYVVAEGWVSPRDFLIGLAIIQSFPGPNFNFAVYLGTLTALNGGRLSVAGAFLGAIGIFFPGLILVHGTMGVWGSIRSWRSVKSMVRGVNAAAVGLIYTAVYRLWQIGWVEETSQQGTSLANDPWWVVVTATSYVGGCWFGLQPPVAIILGAVLGLIRYGVVSA